MADARRAQLKDQTDISGARALIVEARFYDDIQDALLEGAVAELKAAGVGHEVITVPGALEIPAAIAIALDAAENSGKPYDAAIALGCVVRGDTIHFEIVSMESSRALMDLAVNRKFPLGNGIITVNTDAQAWARARASELNKALDSEKQVTSRALAQIEVLNQQISALRRQLAALEEALEVSEKRDRESQGRIADLGQRLNVALAQRVQELSRYRSEFFGRLRAILGNRPDIRIVGDRFVFQSEVFFDTGQALLLPEGRAELDKLASALTELDKQIPAEIAWVLRVDGHTDVRPILNSPVFKSNWELSSARAISVVQYLVTLGVPAQRLVAAGFAEFQPLDTATTEEAYKRNRRIELKLTER